MSKEREWGVHPHHPPFWYDPYLMSTNKNLRFTARKLGREKIVGGGDLLQKSLYLLRYTASRKVENKINLPIFIRVKIFFET